MVSACLFPLLPSLSTLLSVTTIAPRLPAAGRRSFGNTLDLVRALTMRDLRLQYQESFFGWAWSLARPLSYGLVLYFAFGVILKAGFPDYPLFLMAGVFPWFWFQGAVQQSASVFVGNSGLLKKVRFPRIVLPLSVVLGNTLQFLLSVPVILVFLFGAGRAPHWSWFVTLPLLFVIQFVLATAVALLLASLTVFFRDLEHITEVGLNLLFYATPILYNIERIPEKYRWVKDVNPLAPLAEGWRGVIMNGAWLPSDIWTTLAWTAVLAAAAWYIFRRLEDAFADAL